MASLRRLLLLSAHTPQIASTVTSIKIGDFSLKKTKISDGKMEENFRGMNKIFTFFTPLMERIEKLSWIFQAWKPKQLKVGERKVFLENWSPTSKKQLPLTLEFTICQGCSRHKPKISWNTQFFSPFSIHFEWTDRLSRAMAVTRSGQDSCPERMSIKEKGPCLVTLL